MKEIRDDIDLRAGDTASLKGPVKVEVMREWFGNLEVFGVVTCGAEGVLHLSGTEGNHYVRVSEVPESDPPEGTVRALETDNGPGGMSWEVHAPEGGHLGSFLSLLDVREKFFTLTIEVFRYADWEAAGEADREQDDLPPSLVLKPNQPVSDVTNDPGDHHPKLTPPDGWSALVEVSLFHDGDRRFHRSKDVQFVALDPTPALVAMVVRDGADHITDDDSFEDSVTAAVKG